jgi:hypothetical protein
MLAQGNANQTVSNPGAFDPVEASGLFSFFFGTTLVLWLLAKNFGLIISAIRRF